MLFKGSVYPAPGDYGRPCVPRSRCALADLHSVSESTPTASFPALPTWSQNHRRPQPLFTCHKQGTNPPIPTLTVPSQWPVSGVGILTLQLPHPSVGIILRHVLETTSQFPCGIHLQPLDAPLRSYLPVLAPLPHSPALLFSPLSK